MTGMSADTTRRHRAVRLGLDRVVWQRIELDGPTPGATVAVAGRRRPREVRVDLDTALALVARGVPTVGGAQR